MKLKLERPLAIFDIESTGLSWRTDRIIDLAIVKLNPDGTREEKVYRVNPEQPIPKEAAAVHGITDEDVRDCPTFKEVATEVAAYLSGCDLGGFNVLSYDIPLLEEEFKRAGVMFSSEDRAVVDAQRIFHRKEPRDLSSALKFYSGETHEDAHGALPDVEATISVLEGQYAKYDDLPETVPELSEFCSPPNPRFVDRRGKIVWDGDGEAAINFGKNTGRKLRDMAHTDPSFLQWILDRDFPRDTQEIVRNAMAGQFPRKPDPDSDE